MQKKVEVEISMTEILTVAFIVLKVTHVINWDWLWVFSPLWIWFLLMLTLNIIASIISLLR
jgi:hypothetical protein